MRPKDYKILCSQLLGVPISTIHITRSGQINLSYQKGKTKTEQLTPEQAESFQLVQKMLTNELSLKEKFEQENNTVRKLQRALDSRLEFFDGVGHELRSPLNAVLNLSEVLTEMKLPKDVTEVVATVNRSAQQVSRLVEDALSLSSLDKGQLKVNLSTIKPADFLTDLWQQLSSIGKLYEAKIKTRVKGKLPEEIHTDPEKLRQIISALVAFCFHSPSARKVTTSASVSWKKSGLYLTISAPHINLNLDVQQALLRPWPTSAEESQHSGKLSMIVANSLLTLMQGTLEILTDKESGCLFKVWIPATLSQVETSPTSLADDDDGPRILAADDDPTSLFALEHVVRKLGYEMTAVESGTTVLKQLATERYSLLLLDLRMPGMDGYQVAKMVKDELELDIPIVAMSADTTEQARSRANEAGMIDFLPKPLRRARLAQVFLKVLGRAPSKKKTHRG